MNVALDGDLERFVKDKVSRGEFRSEAEVIEAALVKFRDEESPGLEAMIDVEFEAYRAREGDDRITMEEVLAATSRIPGSMAQAIMDQPWRATIPSFRDEALYRQYRDILEARRRGPGSVEDEFA